MNMKDKPTLEEILANLKPPTNAQPMRPRVVPMMVGNRQGVPMMIDDTRVIPLMPDNSRVAPMTNADLDQLPPDFPDANS